MKRRISIVLAFVMVLSFAMPTFAKETKKEVGAREAAEFLNKHKILVGDEEGDLMLDKSLLRRDTIILISKLVKEHDEAKSYDIESSKRFKDVDIKSYRSYVAWAYDENHMIGKSNDKFGFDEDISASQYALVLLKILKVDGLDQFKAHKEASKLGLYKGMDNPSKHYILTRGDMALMTYNALFLSIEGQTILAEELGFISDNEDKTKDEKLKEAEEKIKELEEEIERLKKENEELNIISRINNLPEAIEDLMEVKKETYELIYLFNGLTDEQKTKNVDAHKKLMEAVEQLREIDEVNRQVEIFQERVEDELKSPTIDGLEKLIVEYNDTLDKDIKVFVSEDLIKKAEDKLIKLKGTSKEDDLSNIFKEIEIKEKEIKNEKNNEKIKAIKELRSQYEDLLEVYSKNLNVLESMQKRIEDYDEEVIKYFNGYNGLGQKHEIFSIKDRIKVSVNALKK